MPKQPRLLVTGFTPFPSAPENPTEVLVKAMAHGEVETPAGTEVRSVLLPTEFKGSVKSLQQALQDFKPDGLIEFGLSAQASGFTLERVARNVWSSELPDNSGFRPHDSEIVQSGAAIIETTLPINKLYDDLKALDLPADYSDSAGAYVCNHLFYQTMVLPDELRPTVAGFIHVPYLIDQRDRLESEGRIDKGLNGLSQHDFFRGVAAILKRTAAHLQL